MAKFDFEGINIRYDILKLGFVSLLFCQPYFFGILATLFSFFLEGEMKPAST